MDKRVILRSIKKRWEEPNKLLEFLIDMDKQAEKDLEIAYHKGMKDTVENYTFLFAYSLKVGGAGKKTLPKYIENIKWASKQLEEGKLTIEDMKKEIDKMGINLS